MCNQHEKRELRQLWFGASLYLKLAEELKGQLERELDRTTAQGAHAFVTDIPHERSAEHRLAKLGAHIASAGIRLGSIHEFLNPKEGRHCRDVLRTCDAKKVGKEFDADLAKYVSILLRDNVAHVEGAEPAWVKREDYLAKKTYRQLYEAILQDSRMTGKLLETKGVL